MPLKHLRAAEWVLIGYFGYVTAAAPFFALRPGTAWVPPVLLGMTAAVFLALAWAELRRSGNIVYPIVRDWLLLALTVVAYREMDIFAAAIHDRHLERQWIVWDRLLLHQYGFQRAVEAGGSLIPNILELSYFVVYAVAPFGLTMLYVNYRRERSPTVLLFYELATLLVYACFPFFPSEPPRTVFPGADMPSIVSLLRHANLGMVNGYGIHSSVFPSAHVSSAFGAAFGTCIALREKPWIGRAMLIYAAVVTVATVYGRYHYAVDAVAGVVVSLIALAIGLQLIKREPSHSQLQVATSKES
jgi:membrane-associated phospholipid phosphatase